MTKEETAKLLAYLASAYPQVLIKRENAEVYHLHLKDLDFAKCFAAAEVLISSEKWFPSIAQIKQQVNVNDGLIGPSVSDAWSEVLSKAQTLGRTAKPSFSHLSITTTVLKIGWHNICMSSPEVARFQFQQVYDQQKKNIVSLANQKVKEVKSANL